MVDSHETTKVWRVQSPNGMGPYCYDGDVEYDVYEDAMSFIDSSDQSHPGTSMDPLLAPFWLMSDDYSFPYENIVGARGRHGFRSVEAMLNWFHSCSLDALLAAGFEVVEYDVPIGNVLHGTYQSVFMYEAIVNSTVAFPSTRSEA